ncbi:RIP metalloprotease RseP [Nicoliella spurrieriana]|uniref:Zinc metalloprotease n=1 Tax=Nicoliella spurrieriana TaxID=2925830 RepID=A0A976RRN2_9LACO|nr:RIP metalloprotease RseP [Nicoliella spurrieriana]UQS86501.1 RIP metalloprotease RseP [Nicoliella spurrieriana]
MFTTIIAFIIVFGILVSVHEFGHFIVAKKCGIMVREFSIGMGPKIFAHRYNGTTYTIRILPLGGYVRMAGGYDDDESLRPGMTVALKLNDQGKVVKINTSNKNTLFNGIPLVVTDADLQKDLWIQGYENGDESQIKRYSVDHDAVVIEADGTELQIAPIDVQIQSATVWHRMATNFAGVVCNVLLAVVAYTLLSFTQGGVLNNSNQIRLADNVNVARDAGIKNNDRITKVNGNDTNNWQSLATAIAANNSGKEMNLTVERGNQTKNILLHPKVVTTDGKKGSEIGIQRSINTSFGAIMLSGFTQTYDTAKSLLASIWTMVTGHFSLNDLGGPVAIFANTSQAAQLGISGIIWFIAFLSINLAIMNLLPIPALDGGKIIMNIVEVIRRKPLSEKVEATVTFIGVAFMVILMILVTWNDIERFFIH